MPRTPEECLAYSKRIVCLANSLKEGGLCIAGREILQSGFGDWVRPVSARPRAELTYLEYRYADGSSPALLDVIDVPLLGPLPNGHQTENHLIDASACWRKAGRCSVSRLFHLLDEPATLWTNSDRSASGRFNCVSRQEALGEKKSLLLVDGAGLRVWVIPGRMGRKSFYGEFSLGGELYKLSITDPLVRDRFEARPYGKFRFPTDGRIFLCISLTEPYEGDGRCHKLIAAVIPENPLAPS